MKTQSESKVQIAILAEAWDKLPALGEIPAVEWLLCTQIGPEVYEFQSHGATLARVDLRAPSLDLPNLLGMVATDGEEFERVRQEWATGFPSLRIAIRRAADGTKESILSAAFECIAEELTAQRLHGGRSAMALAAYRREFDRLQRSFSRLEKYVASHVSQSPVEIFEYPAGALAAGSSGGAGQEGDSASASRQPLSQYLPVESLGVSSISLRLGKTPATDAGPLRVKLNALETGKTFGSWRLDPAEVNAGWLELALESAIDEDALTLNLILEWSPKAGGWAFLLGPPHPFPEFCARLGTKSLGAPLAMRIFAGLPGVHGTRTTSAFRTEDAASTFTQYIPFGVCESAAQMIPEIEQNGAALVLPDQGIGCITVHPRKNGLTVARLNVSVPARAWALSAQIHLAHSSANSTEFAMLVCPQRRARAESARLNLLDTPTPDFSGWRALSAFETGRILVSVSAQRERQLCLLLATRQAPDSSPDFAWARFSQLRFHLLPDSLPVEGLLTPGAAAPPEAMLHAEPPGRELEKLELEADTKW